LVAVALVALLEAELPLEAVIQYLAHLLQLAVAVAQIGMVQLDNLEVQVAEEAKPVAPAELETHQQ
jgi:hypothetical protein